MSSAKGLVAFLGVGDGIVAVTTKGMAFAKAAQGQERAADRAMFFQRLKRIGRAGRLKPAVMTNPWRKNQPVGAHGQGNDMGERCHGAKVGAQGAREKGARLFVRMQFAQGIDEIALKGFEGTGGGL